MGMQVPVRFVIVPTIGVKREINSNVQSAEKYTAVKTLLNAVVILASANIPFVASAGIHGKSIIRYVLYAIISWVIQNQNISCTMIECFATIMMLIDTFPYNPLDGVSKFKLCNGSCV